MQVASAARLETVGAAEEQERLRLRRLICRRRKPQRPRFCRWFVGVHVAGIGGIEAVFGAAEEKEGLRLLIFLQRSCGCRRRRCRRRVSSDPSWRSGSVLAFLFD